jgi:hypothetical protein
MEKTYFPFKLLVIIHSASDLPVADVFASDPYIIASLGDRIIGRTKTIKRNLNPIWNETLPHQSLLHYNYEIEFKVFDEDPGSDADYLGHFKVDLKDFPSDGSVTRRKYPMINAPKYKSKSFVETSIILARNDNVIQIQSKNMPRASFSGWGDYLPEAVMSRVESEPLWETSSEIIKSTIREAVSADSSSSELLSIPFIRDLLCDTSIFLQDQQDHKYYLIELLRAKLRLQNSTKLILYLGETYPHYPIEENSLQINLSQDDTKFILLTFANRFMIWSWMKWIRLAYDYWLGAIAKDHLPDWANGMIRSSLSIIELYDGRNFTKKIVLDLNTPFVLKIGDEFISVQTMISLISSVDSYVPDCYSMDIQLTEGILTDFQKHGISGLDITNEKVKREHEQQQQQQQKDTSHQHTTFGLPIGGGRLLKGAFSTVKKGAHLVKDTALGVTTHATHAAVGVTTTTVNAVRIISTGDPKKVIRGAQDKIYGVGHHLTTTLVNAPQALFGKASTYVSVRSRDSIFHLPLAVDQAEVHYFDFELSDLYKVTGIEHRALKDSIDAMQKKFRLLPVKKPDSLSLDCTLYQGVEGAFPKVYGQNSLKVKKIINSRQGSNKSEKLQQMDIAYGEPHTTEVLLNKAIGYSCTVQGCNNLFLENARKQQHSHKIGHLPKDALIALSNLVVNSGIVVKVKLVSINGHSGYTTVGEHHKTKSVNLSSDPEWNHNFTLLTGHLVEDEFYVRLEFYLDDLATMTCIGSTFIPLDYFGVKEQDCTFPISRFRGSSQFYQFAINNNNNGYGEVRVRLKKIEEEFGANGKYKFDLLTTIRESSLFNTSWYAEILPASGIDSENSSGEVALVTVLHDGLQLSEQETLTLMEARKIHSSSAIHVDPPNTSGDERPTEAWKTLETMNASAMKEFWIEIWENERRTPYPPFDWSTSTYTRAHYSDLSYKKAYKIGSLNHCPPPDQSEWLDDWQVDKQWIRTNDEGWIYGFTFGAILSNYKKNVSYISSKGCNARRRKWKRKARLLPGADLDIGHLISSFGKATSIKSMDEAASSDRTEEEVSVHSKDPPLTPKSSQWRKTLANNNPDHGILSTCMEKTTEDSPIVIDWNEILNYTVITPSILSVSFMIHRYFPEIDTFRLAEVEMFISNCNALEFQSLIDERIWCHKIRSSIRRLISSGNLYGNKESYDARMRKHEHNGDGKLNPAIDEESLNLTESIPETEELSLGSETIKELDDQLIDLQNQLTALNQKTIEMPDHANSSPHTMKPKNVTTKAAQKQLNTQKQNVERRIIRLKLYISGLFGSNLKGIHNYEESEIRRIMFQDFHRAKIITLDNDVATANNRIEYLLDMAEMRIRDAALCGWRYRETKLEKCLEIIANGYFIEIVSILGKFFERSKDEVAEVNL